MPKINFIQPDGKVQTVDAENGQSAMYAAQLRGIPGIVAECGGSAVCATCHVYVDDAWLEEVGEADEDESELLEGVATERLPSSRLSCQIKMSGELDGLTLRLPERQL